MTKPRDRRHDDVDEQQRAWAKGLQSGYDHEIREPVSYSFRDLLDRLEAADLRSRQD